MRRPVLLAAFIALAVRALVVARLPAPPAWDGALYAHLAEHLAHGLGYTDGPPGAPHATAFYPVGYPALLSLFLRAGVSTPLAAHALNVLAAAVAAACAAALGTRVAGTRGGYFAGLAYALAPGPALWCAAAMTETVTGALLVGATLCATTPVSRRRTRILAAAGAGLLTGVATLVRPQVLLAAPFLGALAPAGRSTRLLAAVVCVACTALVVLPWTARNAGALGAPVLVSTNGGSNLLIGTFAEADGGYRAPTPADGCAEARGEVAKDRCMSRVAVRRIARAPWTWARLGLLKLARTFGYEWAPVSYLRGGVPGAFAGDSAERVAVLCSAWWWGLLGAALFGGRRAARTGARAQALARIVGLIALLFALTHAVFLGDDRYHLPLVPLLAPLAAGLLLPSRPPPEPELVWAG